MGKSGEFFEKKTKQSDQISSRPHPRLSWDPKFGRGFWFQEMGLRLLSRETLAGSNPLQPHNGRCFFGWFSSPPRGVFLRNVVHQIEIS